MGRLAWGARWAFDQPNEEELDPVLLMWWIRQGTVKGRLPRERVTGEFHLTDDRHGRYWLVVSREDVSVCFDPPPFDVDLCVETDLRSLYRVWLGRVTYHDALARGELDVHGTPALEAAFPTWFDWSPASDAVRAAWGRPVRRPDVSRKRRPCGLRARAPQARSSSRQATGSANTTDAAD